MGGGYRRISEQQAFIQSLGCPKNLVDTEMVMADLNQAGYTFTQDPGEADLILVNTCSFIQPATEEAIETILHLAREKKEGRCKMLLVGGCLPRRYGRELLAAFPEVDGFFTPDTLHRFKPWISIIRNHQNPNRFLEGNKTRSALRGHPRILGTPFYRAYLKIAEGCSHGCRFCLIPRLRGPFRSRRFKSLIQEAEALAESGVKELTLVAQDITQYGKDLYGQARLPQLLTRLCRIPRIEWILLLYLHPSGVTPKLLETIAGEKKICRYLDIPFQHCNGEILKRMGRKETPGKIYALIQLIKEILPDAALRTSLIVGYPGETEKAFQELLEFVTMTRFHNLGAFPYSPESGTAAHNLKGRIAGKIQEKRYARTMERQSRISREILKGYVGKELPVLIEGESRETPLLLEGRTSFQAPDIDGVVYINEGFGEAGATKIVRISEAHTYDLVGCIVSD